jgi:cyclopropane-fatty-acyl-phospholipid synthase
LDRLLELLLRQFVRRGRLQITTARGTVFSLGDGSGPPVAVRFTSTAAQRSVMLDPEVKLGEAYMDGAFVVEEGTIADVMALVLGQRSDGAPPTWARPQWLLRYINRRLQQFNRRTRARRNVAHHYDLDGRLYSLFLDADQQYSCAYFESPEQALDDAQLAKKRHLAAKLMVGRDCRVLDIGCGWGGLALYLAEICGGLVTGITLSREQSNAPPRREWRTGPSSACRTTVICRRPTKARASTASSRSACSSTSGSATTTHFSASAPSCWPTTAS